MEKFDGLLPLPSGERIEVRGTGKAPQKQGFPGAPEGAIDLRCLLIAPEMLDIINKINKKRKIVPHRTNIRRDYAFLK